MSEFHAQADIAGDNNIGLYGFASDSYCLAGYVAKRKNDLGRTLCVDVHEASIMGLNLAKLFVAGNSSFLFIPDFLFDKDKRHITAAVKGVEIIELETEKALGNLMLLNDKGIIISPLIHSLRSQIERRTGLPVEVSTVAKLSMIGSAGLATNKGCLLHPQVTRSELARIEKTLGVNADIGTVSFGSPYPGSGVIANSNGFVASSATSGPELGRIAEALGFVE